MPKYLDYDGLLEFKSLLDLTFEEKVDGKGLSTNDFTTDLKNKLDNIEAGATANEGTVTGVTINNVDYIPINGQITLPDYPTTLPASDVSSWAKLSTKPSYTLDEVTDGTNRKIPTKTSDLVNDSGFTTGSSNVSGISVNSTEYTPSLSGIITIPDYPTTLPASDVSSWAKESTKPSYNLDEVVDGSTRKIPTKVSDLTNDSGFLTSHQSLSGYATETWVSDKFDDVLGINASGIDALTTALSDNDAATGILKAIADKVDKESGKRLMTDAEGTKLSGIETGAQVHIAPTSAEVKSALGTGSGTTKYLREDGTWATPPDTDTNTVTSINGKTGAIAAADIATVLTGAGYKLTDTDTNTTYSGSSTVTLTGTTFSLTKANVTTALGYTPPTTDTNTWRGILNNLTSNSTSDSLSAAQGKALANGSARDNTKVAKTGDTMSNALAICATTYNDYNEGIRIQDAPNKWAGITLGATGLTGCSPQSGEVAWFVAKRPGGVFSITPNTSSTGTGLELTSGGNAVWRGLAIVLNNDSRLSNSRPASDVYSWAKASSKPSYSWSEIGSRPTALSSFTNDSGYIAGTADVSATANTIAKRDAHGYLYATYYNLSSGSETPTKDSYMIFANSDGWFRKSTIANMATAMTNAGYKLTDNNTTYSAGTGLSLSGTTFSLALTKALVTTALGYTPPTSDTNTWRPLGTGASDACAGNDSRLSNSRPASDVYSWAKASSKPSYGYGEISHGVSSATTSGAISLAGTTPLHIITLNGNASSVALSSNPVAGHSCHIIFFSTAARTVTIAHNATARVCPGAADVTLNVPANGYAEVDFLYDGSKTWVRGV